MSLVTLRRSGPCRESCTARRGRSPLSRFYVLYAALRRLSREPSPCRGPAPDAPHLRGSRGDAWISRFRNRYFARNELSRLCLGLLRTAAGEPLSTDDIAGRIIAAKGFDAGDRIWRAAIRDDVMMTEPPPARRIAGTAYFTDRNTLLRLTAVITTSMKPTRRSDPPSP